MHESPRAQKGRKGSTASGDDIHYVSYKTSPRKVGVYGQRCPGQGRRSSKFDVPIEGAIDTRRSWRDSALGSWAGTNSNTSSPVSAPSPARNFHTPPSPLINSPSPRPSAPCTCPDAQRYRKIQERHRGDTKFSLFEEPDMEVVNIDPPAAEDTQRHETLPADEEDVHVRCALIGPVFPIIGKLSLRQVGWSSILNDNTLLVWRFVQVALALAACIISGAASWKTENLFLVGVSSIAMFNAARMASLVIVYRWHRDNKKALSAPHAIYG